MNINRILILGVTASAKSRLGFDLASRLDAEIISIDSMKVYRRMNIGTAKPPAELRKQLRYHLIDVVEPSESFSVAQYLEQANNAIKDISNRGKNIVAVGGTALYIKSLLFGLFDGPGTNQKIRDRIIKQANEKNISHLYEKLRTVDPQAAQRIHINDTKRIIRAIEVYELTGKPISSFQKQWENSPEKIKNWTIVGIRRPKQIESQRINARVKKMIHLGLLDEVQSLVAEKKPLSPQAASAIGYAEIIKHLNGDIELEQAIELIKKNSRKLAKGQRTWFKTFTNVNWIDLEHDDDAQTTLKKTTELLQSIPNS